MDAFTGLTQDEADRRLAEIGPNALPRPRGRNLPRIVFETAREPMFVLLLGAAILYLVLGDLGEGAFLLAGAVLAVGLVILQEARSERALAALREFAEPQARVIRDGAQRRIPARELVPGDILLAGEGERLPADAVLVGGDPLSVDEAALTGESAPVSKRHARGEEDLTGDTAPGADKTPFLFAGTLIVRGQGVARVARTGPQSALGRIGSSLAEIGEEPTALQKTAGRLVGLLGLMAIAFCGLVVAAYGLIHHDWIEGVLAGITVAIALIPEEFPMVLAVFLALGAWRLATHKVLVRRTAAIEALGGATVLCVDKTGTLTENRMQVARLWTPGEESALLDVAALASALHPVDPMDRAIRERARPSVGELERSWPLRPGLMAVVQLWRSGEARIAAAKGAPEEIFRLCKLPHEEIRRLHGIVHGFAEEGLRVLGVASCHAAGAFPDDPKAADFRFEGLIGFVDPVRPEVPPALKEALAAGVKVMMITGDHPSTALAIARAVGIDTAAGAMLGAEVKALPFPALRDRLREVRVFARIAPEQKLLIVEALKADGEVVAMTGDGVNDAPALEAAHIGIAMGRKGTDVAREAADLVLLDDSFASIVGGVRLGRRIFANLRRALSYITAIHIPIAGLALMPVIAGLPPLLMPMHVVLLELAIDPICSLVFEGEPSDAAAMKRPPRRPDEALFGPPQLLLALLQGAGVLGGVFGLYVWALGAYTVEQARGAAFIALVLGNLILALADAMSGEGRLFAPHRRVFWAIAAGIAVALGVVFTLPAARHVFEVARPDAALLLTALGIAVVGGAWLNVARRVARR
ncbi:MAG: cation-translocating P-type ATPase [Ignavibacteriales bacterium]